MICNSCDSKEFSNYFNYKDIDLLLCKQCKLISIDKIPSYEVTASYYQDEFYNREKSERFIKLFEVMLKFSRYFRVLLIQQFCKNTGKMVDVGFSRGITMSMLKSKGWLTFGTQISFNAYKNASKNGLDVFLGELEAAKISAQSIDLVTFWHVLEHTRNPAQYLKETNRILKNKGKLIIEVPNIGSFIARVFKKKWFGLDLPRHIYHFTPESLSFILKKNGFHIAKREYYSLEQSTFSLLQSTLNLFNYKDNVLFESSKKNKKVGFLGIYNWFLVFIFLVPTVIISWLMGIAGFGDIMRFYCTKVKEI